MEFDDFYLSPKLSRINSREDVHLAVPATQLKLSLPIIASPMKGIVGPKLIAELSKLGGIGILHRFYADRYEWRREVKELENTAKNFGIAVGLDWHQTEIVYAIQHGASIICIDVANGYLKSVQEFISYITNIFKRYDRFPLIMAGNVVNLVGASALVNAGSHMVRVGIGSGNLCITRKVTGVGRGQASALIDCSKSSGIIVADGGIRSSGDMVKAFACGADYVMLGSLLAQAEESSHNGIIYGMASRQLQEEYYHSVKSVEGITQEAEKTKPLAELVDEWVWGIKSACTYLNVRSIQQLRNCEFYPVKE